MKVAESGMVGDANQVNRRCFDTRVVHTNRESPSIAALSSTRGRSCSHHCDMVVRDLARTGRTLVSTCINGDSYFDASSSSDWCKKSTIHISRDLCVTSFPLIHGTTTSLFGLPCGLGCERIARAE